MMDRLWETRRIPKSTRRVRRSGLPPGSWVTPRSGHLTIGAGRVIYQDVMRITKAIETGAFFRNEVAAEPRCASGARAIALLHLWGLLSDGSVHSHIDHLMALIEWRCAKVSRISRFMRYWMGATSRRDPPCRSSRRSKPKLKELGRGRIATVTGRYFAMDRDKRWDRVERGMAGDRAGRGAARCRMRARQSKRLMPTDKNDEFVEPSHRRHAASDG